MKLDTFAYTELPGQPGEWTVGPFKLGQINLVVGRNAVGKSRLLNTITGLGRFFTGEQKELLGWGKYKVNLQQDPDSWEYEVAFGPSEIESELLLYNGTNVLQRGKGGQGQIEAEDVEGKKVRMRFQASLRELGIVAKRDPIQHPYLVPLSQWGNDLRHFQFGSELRTFNLAIRVPPTALKIDIDEKNTSVLVPIFDLALKAHGDRLIEIVLADMKLLGYTITDLAIRKPDNVIVAGIILASGELLGISAKESELDVRTDQPFMSQGMFRSLSLLLQTTHYQLSGKSGCIVVDDIGEGLDFERSQILIDLLRGKAQHSNFQLIMSTNNRFVMNEVPLEEWCFLLRKKGEVTVKNYANSAEAFERFKITGLNNFDLLATDFLAK
jgi:energy-coupling factor transporter ATP-binding protein EcfA2